MTPIVDAHQHIWRCADLPWLAGQPVPRIFGEYGALRYANLRGIRQQLHWCLPTKFSGV